MAFVVTDDPLTVWLNAWYTASQMGKGSTADVQARFAKRIAASADMKAAAQKRLKSLTKSVCDRDHVSRVHKDILERVLNG